MNGTFAYSHVERNDVDGLAKLAAVIPHTGQTVRLEYTPSQKRLDAEGKELSQQRVDDLWQRSPAAKRFQGILAQAEAMLLRLPEAPRLRLQQSLEELKAALASGDTLAIQAAGLRLTCLMVELEKGA